MKRSRVLLGEDHALLIDGLRRIIETEFECVAAVTDGLTLVSEALRLKPDIVLTDVSMPILDGMEAARRIKEALPDVRIAFLTMHDDVTYLADAFRLGASGYILKRSTGNELLEALRQVGRGKTYVAPELSSNIGAPQFRQSLERGMAAKLSVRQLEILRHIAAGNSNDEIAAALNIAPCTVRSHRSTIERKLGISGTAWLTRYALAHRTTETP